MRLWWITAAALLVLGLFGCLFGPSESAENGYVDAKDFRTGQSSPSSSSENKVTMRRRLVRRRMDSGEIVTGNGTLSQKEPVSEDLSLPKSSSFTAARRALFTKLNKPLLENRSLDATISKLRSRLGAVDSAEQPSKPRYYKKVIKKVTTAKPENPMISIQVPTDKPSYNGNDSMIMIPVPESQRKPYQPVIMQVTKSNESSTASPDTKVVTYKLNKMFVPMGIYGRVVQDANNATEVKGPEVRHKGTQSESSEKSTGVKVTEGSEGDDMMKDIKSKSKKTRKQKEHSSIADSVDITYNYRPRYDEISLTTEKMDASRISLTTEQSPFNVDQVSLTSENRRTSNWGPTNSNKKSEVNKLSMMSPPGPMRKESTSSNGAMGFLDSLKHRASNIPSLFHKGFTSLTSITNSYSENPFHDDTFTSGTEIRPTISKKPTILGAVPGGFIPKTKKPSPLTSGASTLSDYETLEYFRNRPHLFGRQNKFKDPVSGFKPVTAQHMEYFGSTSPSPRQADSYSSASSQEVKASPATWKSSSFESKGVPTEELSSTWKDRLFKSQEYGTEPAYSRSWRNILGLAPTVEESSMASSMYGNRFPMMDGGRRRSMLLDNHWKDITAKYTPHEIDEAKERIYEAFSGPEPRSSDEINVMRPPSPRAGGAFEDLMKMFKLWFNVGHGKSMNLVKNFDHIKSSESSRSSEDNWKPISKSGVRAGGKPLISFSAGISFPTKNPSPKSGGTHYNASPKPFIPNKFNKGLSNHITTLAGNTKPTPFFGKESNQYTSHSIESSYSDEESQLKSHFAFPKVSDPLKESASNIFATSSGQTSDDSPYELVPSDVYFSQKNPNLGEIAAVVKPQGISDEELKARLPAQVTDGVPTLNFPSNMNRNPQQSFSSLNHLQQYLTTSDAPSQAFLLQKQMAEEYRLKEQSFMLPQKYYDAQYASTHFQRPYQPFSQPQLYKQQIQQQPQQSYNQFSNGQGQIIQQQTKKTSGDSGVGFSDFELPSNTDPDIAALLKAELDKDDVPEEIRKEFEDAKKEESRKTQSRSDYLSQQSQQSQNLFQSQRPMLPSTVRLRPSYHQSQFSRPVPFVPATRRQSNIVSKFFAPIPISKTHISQTLRGRYQSPVPRYVVELAKKLQRDKDVQGIVRVSTKRGHGPPIEYLYPVRG